MIGGGAHGGGVALELEQVVAAGLDDGAGGIVVGVAGVGAGEGAIQRGASEQGAGGGGLVLFVAGEHGGDGDGGSGFLKNHWLRRLEYPVILSVPQNS